MEYNFINKDTLNNIINNFISSLPERRQEKALINIELLERIKKILLDPSNKKVDTKNTREWARKRKKLPQEIIGSSLKMIINLF